MKKFFLNIKNLFEKFNLKDFSKQYGIYFLTFIIAVISFPGVSPEYDGSYDGSAYWGLNYLFANDVSSFNNLIFPWGPLSFLKVPVVMGNHVLFAIITLSIFWVTFIYLTLLLAKKVSQNRFPFAFIVVLIMAMFFQLDQAIITIVAVSLLINNFNKSWIWIIIAAITASIGMYIKANIGIISYTIIASQLLYDLVYLKNYKQFFINVLIILIAILIPGIIIFHSISATFIYFINVLKLTFSYSGTQSLFPENNFFVLIPAILLFFIFPFLVKDKNVRKAYAILFLSFFINWKYAISREDLPHYSSLYTFIVLGFGIFIIYAEKVRFRQIILPLIIFSLFYLNMTFFPYFSGRNIEYSRISRINDCFFNLSSFEEFSLAESKSYSAVNILESSILKEISNSTVDVYPWNLAYISENNLNWKQGRQLLYLAYSSSIDNETAADFSIKNGPDYLIFHSFNNRYNGTLGSLDNRYMLNDEPNTILAILNNYLFVREIPNGAILYKKLENSRFNENVVIKKENVNWSEWITIPKITDGILRAKTHFDNNILQSVKSFLYKGQQFYIEYKLFNGKIFKYSFNPQTAINGLWINPYFNDYLKTVYANQVQAIRFSCDNENGVSTQINLEWEEISFTYDIANKSIVESTPFYKTAKLFGLQENKQSAIMVNVNDFENTDSLWSYAEISNKAYTGKSSGKIVKQGYSSTFSVNSTEFANDSVSKILINVTVFSNLPKKAKGSLVITYNDDSLKTNDLYSYVELPNVSKVFNDNWGYSQLSLEITIPANSKGKINTYVWNFGNEDFVIDDYEVSIFKIQ
jgi:hypothetical protein